MVKVINFRRLMSTFRQAHLTGARRFYVRSNLCKSSTRWNIDELNEELEQYLGSFNDYDPLSKSDKAASSQISSISQHALSVSQAPNETCNHHSTTIQSPPGDVTVPAILVLHDECLSLVEVTSIQNITSAMNACLTNIISTPLTGQNITSHILSAPYLGLVVVASNSMDSHAGNVLQLCSKSTTVALVSLSQVELPHVNTVCGMTCYNGLLAAIIGILGQKLRLA